MSEKSFGKVFLYWIQLYRTIFQFGRQWKWWKIVHILYHIFYRDLVCYRSCKIHFIQFLWMHSIWDILVQIKSQSRIKQHHIFQIPFLPKVQKLSLLMGHLSTTQAKKNIYSNCLQPVFRKLHLKSCGNAYFLSIYSIL